MRLPFLLLAAGLVLAGCTSNDGGSPSPTPTASPSPSPTATGSPSPSPSPTTTASPSPSPSPTPTPTPDPEPKMVANDSFDFTQAQPGTPLQPAPPTQHNFTVPVEYAGGSVSINVSIVTQTASAPGGLPSPSAGLNQGNITVQDPTGRVVAWQEGSGARNFTAPALPGSWSIFYRNVANQNGHVEATAYPAPRSG